ncbi:VOC family protein [Microtetraspora sp. AC03309]|uniref:VOC family protein n=1 Tax=Microtetraspora sp. AC03309 TaxID=2779376 RepID=UPI001E5B947B|nr:VOC family protein [Microtetraspora sp. AC03309]MCC5580687.1 VOC family protein [Microtetraspora sp. AC03309]
MSVPVFNTIAWFEVAGDDPDGLQRFYGDLFGWRFAVDQESAESGMDYRLISYAEEERPRGGVLGAGGSSNHAVFTVAVKDVEATCTMIEGLGGKVESKQVGDTAGPDHAYVRDTAGNLFGLFTPKAG